MSHAVTAVDIVGEAISLYNREVASERRLPRARDTPLFGSGGSLDSLAMISLVVLVEETAEARLCRYLPLADALSDMLDQERAGAVTIGQLIDLVAQLSANP